jgi:predicted ATP-grasp superfamily ATP-dependent carboligase
VRILVYEFVTGGGLAGEPLPPGLVREADMILRALLTDLSEVRGVELLTTRDSRLGALSGAEVLTTWPEEDGLTCYQRGLVAAAAAWPTAPETSGVLERLASMTLKAGKLLLGCPPDAVRLSASKLRTAAVLAGAGIPAVPTFARASGMPTVPGRWVVKPDDGAGCDSTAVVPDWREAQQRLQAGNGRLVAQPWVEGDPRSLSLLCAGGQTLLLSVNRQRMRILNGHLSLVGLGVNAFQDPLGHYADLARGVVAAIPSLRGYVGIDFIQTAEGPMVLEVNPRLTTSYCGLRTALGVNIAAMVTELFGSSTLPAVLQKRANETVEIVMESAGD